jgi:hypothetical protein
MCDHGQNRNIQNCDIMRIFTSRFEKNHISVSNSCFYDTIRLLTCVIYIQSLFVMDMTHVLDCNGTQDTQYTYNVTLKRLRESLLPWKSNKYYIFVRACAPACV